MNSGSDNFSRIVGGQIIENSVRCVFMKYARRSNSVGLYGWPTPLKNFIFMKMSGKKIYPLRRNCNLIMKKRSVP